MNKLITILGPTASGKTTLATHIAVEINGEIISADSRQVYRKMDIGTGKDLSEYVVNDKKINTHLIDIADAGSRYNVFEFISDFSKAFNQISSNNKTAILCGGTGMYLDAIIRGYKMGKVPTNNQLRGDLLNHTHNQLVTKLSSYGLLHNVSDTTDHERLIRAIEIADYQAKHTEILQNIPKFSPIIFGINYDRQIIRERITQRLESRLDEGMILEVENLLNSGIKPEQLIYYGLEYKFLTMYVIGDMSYNEMFEKLNIAIHQFAKRQMTWFRRMEKNGVKINWIDGALSLNDKLEVVRSKVKSKELKVKS